MPHKERDNDTPERPLECSECKKSIKVIYTEIVGQKITRTCMCADCPELQKRLRGSQTPAHEAGLLAKGATGLACGECGTLLESVQKGHDLGCSICYEVFDEALVADMISEGLMPDIVTKGKRRGSLHKGRSIGETPRISTSLKLIALNEALKDTLKREDYEQAALLRDEIKELTENSKLAPKKKKIPVKNDDREEKL